MHDDCQTYRSAHMEFSLSLYSEIWGLNSFLQSKQSYSLSHSIGLYKIFEKIKNEQWSSHLVAVTHVRDNQIVRRK